MHIIYMYTNDSIYADYCNYLQAQRSKKEELRSKKAEKQRSREVEDQISEEAVHQRSKEADKQRSRKQQSRKIKAEKQSQKVPKAEKLWKAMEGPKKKARKISQTDPLALKKQNLKKSLPFTKTHCVRCWACRWI